LTIKPGRGQADDEPVRVSLIGERDGALRVDYTGGGNRAAGITAFAMALSRRVNMHDGAAGPVDDSGNLLAPGWSA
jgi:hypothetical protein